MERSWSFQGRRAAFTWFTADSQLQSVIREGVVPEWFHGIISRKRAEELLMSRPPGHFLIRVSESRAGYTLSYRGKDCCRHFKIDALEDGRYVVVGDDRRHPSLQDLVDHHRRTPIRPFMEVLTVACGQRDYAGIVFPQKHPIHDASLQPNSSLLLRASHPVSQEDIPPALPHRPNNPVASAVPSPSSQSNRHNPGLGGENRMFTALLPAMLVPIMPKIIYAADNPPSNRPSSGPLVKQNQAFFSTVSALEGSSSPMTTEHRQCANIQPVKNQRAKPSLFSNMKNVKKKLQKETSMSSAYTHKGNNVKATDKAGEQFPRTDGVLPEEYNPPPPFAPGYTAAPF